MRRVFPLLFSFFVLIVAGEAAPRKWVKAHSQNFDLFTTAGEKRARDAVVRFESVLNFFVRVNRAGTTRFDKRVNIVMFSSEKEYRPYRASDAAVAFYAPGHVADYIVLHGGGDDNDRIAVHEFVHLLMKEQKAPLWLREGLAEVWSTLKPIGSKVRMGDVIPGHYVILQLGKWLELEQLTEVTHDSPIYNEKERSGLFYAESWALAHMLVLTDEYRPKLAALGDAFAAGASNNDAFWKVYGKSIQAIGTELKAYMRRGQFNVGIFNIKLEKAAEQPEISAADPLETNVILANVLAAASKHAEAQAAFEELAAANPRSPLVEEGFGYLWLRQNEGSEARKHFARAVELGSTNPQLYYDHARLTQGRENETAATLMRKAVELKPDFYDAWYDLGFILLRLGKHDEAVKSFLSVRHLKPDRAFALFSALAFAYARLGNKQDARAAVARARPYTRGPSDVEQLDKLIAYLDAPPRRAPASVERAETRVRGDEGRPVLRRPEPDPDRATTYKEEQLTKERPTVEGVIESVDCLGDKARLRLRVAGRLWRLAILEPDDVIILGAGTDKIEFTCGPQNARKVSIAYDPVLDSRLGTQGNVYSIEFK